MKHNKELYRAYLQTPEWKAIRLEVLSIRGYKCERCNSTYKLEVHHKTYKNIFHESPIDLEVLCHTCHKKHHKVQDTKPKPKKRKKYKTYANKVFKNLYAR